MDWETVTVLNSVTALVFQHAQFDFPLFHVVMETYFECKWDVWLRLIFPQWQMSLCTCNLKTFYKFDLCKWIPIRTFSIQTHFETFRNSRINWLLNSTTVHNWIIDGVINVDFVLSIYWNGLCKGTILIWTKNNRLHFVCHSDSYRT